MIAQAADGSARDRPGEIKALKLTAQHMLNELLNIQVTPREGINGRSSWQRK